MNRSLINARVNSPQKLNSSAPDPSAGDSVNYSVNSTSELGDYAMVVAAMVALLVFVLNSFSQVRNRRIENLARFIEVHQRRLPSTDTWPRILLPSRPNP